MFGGLTHQSAIDLAKTLVAITPEPLSKVFFSDSGSVAEQDDYNHESPTTTSSSHQPPAYRFLN
jgi:hypothetical protein